VQQPPIYSGLSRPIIRVLSCLDDLQ
jgi:hypothetical protein